VADVRYHSQHSEGLLHSKQKVAGCHYCNK